MQCSCSPTMSCSQPSTSIGYNCCNIPIFKGNDFVYVLLSNGLVSLLLRRASRASEVILVYSGGEDSWELGKLIVLRSAYKASLILIMGSGYGIWEMVTRSPQKASISASNCKASTVSINYMGKHGIENWLLRGAYNIFKILQSVISFCTECSLMPSLASYPGFSSQIKRRDKIWA